VHLVGFITKKLAFNSRYLWRGSVVYKSENSCCWHLTSRWLVACQGY